MFCGFDFRCIRPSILKLLCSSLSRCIRLPWIRCVDMMDSPGADEIARGVSDLVQTTKSLGKVESSVVLKHAILSYESGDAKVASFARAPNECSRASLIQSCLASEMQTFRDGLQASSGFLGQRPDYLDRKRFGDRP